MTTKQEIIKLIKQLPNKTSVEDVMYELYFKMQVDKGLSDIATGKTISHDKVILESKKWLKK